MRLKKAVFLLLIIVFSLICVLPVTAENVVENKQIGNKVIISGKLDLSKTNELVSIIVLSKGVTPKNFQPGDFLYSNVQLSANGSYSFEMILDNNKSIPLTAWLSKEYGSEKDIEKHDFIYKSLDDLQPILNQINSSLTAQDLETILKREINGITYMEFLGMDKELLTQINPPYTNIFEYLLNHKTYTFENFQDLSKLFERAVLLDKINQQVDADKLKVLLLQNGEALDMVDKTSAIYTIFSEKITNPDDVYYRMLEYPIISEQGLKKAFNECVVLSSIRNPKRGRYEIGFILSNCAEIIGIKNEISTYNNLASSKKAILDKELAGNEYTISALKTKFLDLLETVGTSSSGGGGSGGSSSGSGGFTGNPVTFNVVDPTSQTPVLNIEKPFRDLYTVMWAEESIYGLYNRGVVNGRREGEFAPNENIKREEFLKMILLATGMPLQSASAKFQDVEESGWYEPYVSTAYALKISNGMSDELFGVGQDITRQDLVTIAYKTALQKNVAFSGENLPFSDNDKIAEYAIEAVSKFVFANLVNGNPDGFFNPNDTATRAEASKIVYSLVKMMEGDR